MLQRCIQLNQCYQNSFLITRKIFLRHTLVADLDAVRSLFLRRQKDKNHTNVLIRQVIPLMNSLIWFRQNIGIRERELLYVVLTPC